MAHEFVVPRLRAIDLEAQNLVRSTPVPKDAKLDPIAARMQPATISRPPAPIALECTLRAAAVSGQARDAKVVAKLQQLEAGSYIQPAPLATEDPSIDLRSSWTATGRGQNRTPAPLLHESAVNRAPQADTRLGPGSSNRGKLTSVPLLNPASGQQQAAILGQKTELTRVRQPFRSDAAPMLFNMSSLRKPLPVHGDSALRAAPPTRVRGDDSSLRGKAITMINVSSFVEPTYRQEPNPHLTRYRGPARTSQMVLNESIRPDIAQRFPVAQEPRPAMTRMNDLVKEVEQTMDEGALHAVRRVTKDVDVESRVLATSITHDGKKQGMETMARTIIAPQQAEAYMPASALPSAGIASRFMPAP